MALFRGENELQKVYWAEEKRIWKPLYTIEEAEVLLVGIPYESHHAGGLGGSVKSPNAVRECLARYYTYDPWRKKDLFDYKIYDCGNIVLGKDPEASVGRAISGLRKRNPTAKMIFLGGDHLVTSFIVPNLPVKTLLSLDAHFDLLEDNPDYPHASAMRKLVERGVKVNLCGVRAAEAGEHRYAEEHRVPLSKELDFRGAVDYLSVDIDVLDSVYAETSTPEACGSTVEEVIEQIHNVDFDYCDLVEWVPERGYPAVIQVFKELLFRLVGE